MGVEPIPDDDRSAGEVPGKLAEKVPDEGCLDGNMRMKAEVQTHQVPARGHDQGGNRRDFLVRSAPLKENRSVAPGCPAAAYQGSHQEATFINKHSVGIQATGFFLIRTQSTLTHVRMRTSSRSTDRRSGFWGDHPRECIKREI
jgi:hypothetical protein